MTWTLDGPFGTAGYAYRLTAPKLAFDDTGFVDVRAEGKGRLIGWPMRVPLHLRARAITGVGDTASDILRQRQPRRHADGHAQVRPRRGAAAAQRQVVRARSRCWSTSSPAASRCCCRAASSAISSRAWASSTCSPSSSRAGSGRARARWSPARAKAWVRRLDNSFFADLTGGLPRIETGLTRTRRRNPPPAQSAAVFAQASAVGRGPAQPRRHLPHRRARAAGGIRAAADGPRRRYRPAEGRPVARPAQRQHWA